MSRLFLFLICAIVASLSAGFARDQGVAPADEAACFKLAAELSFNDNPPTGDHVPRLIAACNNAKDACVLAVETIRRAPRQEDALAGRYRGPYPVPKELDCHGYRNPEYARSIRFRLPQPDQRPVTEKAADEACADAAATITTGVALGNLEEQIALCNKHPKKIECTSTRAFIMQNGKDPQGLTCQ